MSGLLLHEQVVLKKPSTLCIGCENYPGLPAFSVCIDIVLGPPCCCLILQQLMSAITVRPQNSIKSTDTHINMQASALDACCFADVGSRQTCHLSRNSSCSHCPSHRTRSGCPGQRQQEHLQSAATGALNNNSSNLASTANLIMPPSKLDHPLSPLA